MSKYSTEFKLEIAKCYINEHHGYRETAKHFNLKTGYFILNKGELLNGR